jgi:two-component system chemotaxis sensor kinase CheA
LNGAQDVQFREMFFEEARELLANLEQGLAQAVASGAERARVDRIYRDAHSLKGAAAMVGYPSIAEAARNLEQSLAQVRTGKTPWTPDLARALVADRNQLQAQIVAEENQFREQCQ